MTEIETGERILNALRTVMDPELGMDVVSLGLVYEVTVADGTAHIRYSLTSLGCPMGPLIESQILDAVGRVPGVTGVEAELTFEPPWSPELMEDEAKFVLGFY